MAPKPQQKLPSDDIDESVRIALDAADAAMDVVSEFARITRGFEAAQKGAAALNRTARQALIAAAAIAGISVLAMALVWRSSASDLAILSATNTELLTVFSENVAALNGGLDRVEAAFAGVEALRDDLRGIERSVAEVAQMSGVLDGLRVEIAAMGEGAADTVLPGVETALAEAVAQIDTRVSTLNGELVMIANTNVRDALAEQVQIYRDLTTEVVAALESGGDSEAEAIARLREAQAEMERRLADVSRRANAANAAAQAAREAQQASDVIKFP